MMDRAPINSALLLTTTRIFNRPGEPSPASPRTMVGGLSLFQRTILTLQRGGISRFIVLAGDEAADLGPPLQDGSGMSQATAGVVTVVEAATPILDVDLAVIPEGFTASGWATPQDSPYPMHAALERAVRQGQARVLPLGSDWYQDVCAEGRAGPDEAERQLLRRLKGGLEGFVDRHFNRRCSRWITRWLVRTPLTPNGVTVLATAVGVLASAALGVGR